MAEVRRRAPAGASAPGDANTSDPASLKQKIKAEDLKGSSISFTDVLRMLVAIALLNSALSYYITGDSFSWGYKPWWTKPTQIKAWKDGGVHLTDAQLREFDGSDPSKPIYLALNGTIYDVTVGKKYYGPGGTYGFFSGRDASRAFITGCFQEDLVPDMRGVEEMFIPIDDPEEDAKLSSGEKKTRRERDIRLAKAQVKEGIEGWAKLFSGSTGRDYFKVGEVVREKDWLEKTPMRELCAAGKQKRKKRKAGGTAAGGPPGGPPGGRPAH